jgi:hypothetical protein
MARDWKHLVAVLFRLGILSLLGATVMVGGVFILLQGAWGGIFLVLSGAVLMAVPAALCATQFLCGKLYGPGAGRKPTDELPEPAPLPAPSSASCSVCQVCRAWMSAELHGAHLPFREVLGMRTRGTPPDVIVDAYVMINRSGMPTTIAALEDIFITERHRIHDAFDLVHVVTGIKD